MPHIILALTINAAGAVGDYIVVMWVLGQPAHILLRDEGTAVSAYKRLEFEGEKEVL